MLIFHCYVIILMYMAGEGTKKWVLYATIGILLLAIVGLTTAIVINHLRGNGGDEGSINVEKLIADYQKKIDAATDDSEKMALYIDRAYDLKQYMLDNDDNQCEQIKADVSAAENLDSDNQTEVTRESLLSACEETRKTIKIKMKLEVDDDGQDS